jgi:hypothetical protein
MNNRLLEEEKTFEPLSWIDQNAYNDFSAYFRGQELLNLLYVTINQYIPEFKEEISSIPEFRKNPTYKMQEIVMAAFAMFLFQMGSRNETNNSRQEIEFSENYETLFGMHLPHMDTVNNVFRNLEPSYLEKLQRNLVNSLLRKKVFDKFKLFGDYYQVVIDGTGLGTVSRQYVFKEIYKTFQSGEKTHYRYVVDAKLVTSNGFSITLATEFVENENEFDKQDCELEACKRLLARVKEFYPRKNLCIQGDALFANASVLELVKKYGWECIVTMKEGTLPSVKDKIIEQMTNTDYFKEFSYIKATEKGNKEFYWTNEMKYKGYSLYAIMMTDYTNKDNPVRFTYLSTISPNKNNIEEFLFGARMRWKIENEGFQTQKIRGYELEHKYSRSDPNASKNYYFALQISHLINQLIELCRKFKDLQKKTTKKHLMKLKNGFMLFGKIKLENLESLLNRKIQFNY